MSVDILFDGNKADFLVALIHSCPVPHPVPGSTLFGTEKRCPHTTKVMMVTCPAFHVGSIVFFHVPGDHCPPLLHMATCHCQGKGIFLVIFPPHPPPFLVHLVLAFRRHWVIVWSMDFQSMISPFLDASPERFLHLPDQLSHCIPLPTSIAFL